MPQSWTPRRSWTWRGASGEMGGGMGRVFFFQETVYCCFSYFMLFLSFLILFGFVECLFWLGLKKSFEGFRWVFLGLVMGFMWGFWGFVGIFQVMPWLFYGFMGFSGSFI